MCVCVCVCVCVPEHACVGIILARSCLFMEAPACFTVSTFVEYLNVNEKFVDG